MQRHFRIEAQPVFVAMAFAAGMVSIACSSFSGSTGTGGSTGSGTGGGRGGSSGTGTGGSGAGTTGSGGSSSSGGAAGACSNVTACGGSVVGTWTVSSSCLNVSGQLDLSNFFNVNCPSGPVTGSLQVSGTWSAKSDGTYVDNTTTTGTEQIGLAAACLAFSGTTISCDAVAGVVQAMGYSAVTCTDAAGGDVAARPRSSSSARSGWSPALRPPAGPSPPRPTRSPPTTRAPTRTASPETI